VAPAAQDPLELGKLRWRCRRGMRELDVVLVRYLERDFAGASSSERDAFRALLDLPDPELFGYLVGRERPQNPDWRDVLARLGAAD
jgi:antitoxin CptB